MPRFVVDGAVVGELVMPLFKRGRQTTDDGGNAVRILNPAGMSEWPSKGDGRIAELVMRLRRVLSRSSTLISLLAVVCVFVVWIGYGSLIPVINKLAPRLPGVVHLMIGLSLIYLLFGLTWRVSLFLRRDQVVDIVLAEGLCPCCAYNFAGMRLEQQGEGNIINCPECGAAWRRSRILRVEAFDPALPTALPTSLVRKRVKVPKWSVADDRGVPIRLVRPVGNTELRRAGLPAERVMMARRRISRSGRWARRIFAAVALAGAISTLVMAVIWPYLAFGMAVIGVIVLVLAGGMYWGNFLYSPRAVREAMLEQSLCPGCASDLLRRPVQADGRVECAVCRGAWRVAPPTEAPV